ncbi:MAG: F0F1 ATP synthase subunit A [Saprospiraceae bacterium]
MSTSFKLISTFIATVVLSLSAFAHDHNHDQGQDHHNYNEKADAAAHVDDLISHEDDHLSCDLADNHGHEEFDPGNTAFHHIGDANVYSIGPWQFPLPCILYNTKSGLDLFLSNKFGFDFMGHGDGHYAYKGYVLDAGTIRLVQDPNFPKEKTEIKGIVHDSLDRAYVCLGDQMYPTYNKSTADFGVFGGGITPFFDFSITKNVFAMILVVLFLSWVMIGAAKAYKKRQGLAPKGTQSFIEVIFAFIQDEVAKPFLGKHYMKYLPFLMALFFFILGLNLFGQIPFFGGANVTGNLAVTMVLAILAFFVTNLSGNKHYWGHIFAMPGVPKPVLTILTPVEFLGVFIKPITLMLRLFANITAGHMVVIIFVSLIFMFSNNGTSYIGGYGTAIVSTALTLFMMAIELLVAFIQAFVFTILTASYIGAAIEEPHH